VSFSINTNVASLQAQNYLRVNSDFQSKTINRVTSGLRIVQSGDDAAGLAIANGYRSDQAVLNQGVRNANDGLSQLQIMDGGMSNISMLLDRARTLATQSASGSFTGGTDGRNVLNGEFQSVLTEISRQAQSIGLNQGGSFASNLAVFIGGGKGTTSAGVISNGTVSVDLSKSTVDAQGLGLKGFTAGWQAQSGAADTGLYDLSSGAALSNVAAIVAAGVTTAGSISFNVQGAGFAGGAGGAITVTASMANVADTGSLVAAINAGIASAAQQGSPQSDAFKAANITAQIHTGADGHQQLQFVSSGSAFQVTANDTTGNALMGNITGATNGSATGISASTGLALAHTASFISQGAQEVTGALTAGQQGAGLTFSNLVYSSSATVNQSQTLTFSINDATGAPVTTSVTLAPAGATDVTATLAVAQINATLQANGNAAVRSIVAVVDQAGTKISFASSSTSAFNVSIGQAATSTTTVATGIANPNTIVGSVAVGTSASSDISTQSGASSAVTALAAAVTALGKAQAVVGRGENQFTYAVNLAQSQLTNLATAESRIRDADLASEAANLTKAQILLQAGVAALAQANSAPQAVLSLLKG
jgi:flagellin